MGSTWMLKVCKTMAQHFKKAPKRLLSQVVTYDLGIWTEALSMS